MATHQQLQESLATACVTNGLMLKSLKSHHRGGTSESSTTSDNTADFIDIVKKHDVVYNTHHPDYKNVEVKLKVWTHIADEIGLSVDASKRKWKNLRDSYTKYLRSFRASSRTSRKYQFWAHAEHMEFLKPFQGPGRTANGTIIPKEEDETECDLGYQVLTKATSNSAEEDEKPIVVPPSASSLTLSTSLASVLPNFVANGGFGNSAIGLSLPSGNTGHATSGAIVLPVPSLPTVQLPPSLTAKPLLGAITNSSSATSTPLPASMALPSSSSLATSLASLATSSVASQVFALPSLSSSKPSIPMPASNTASSVGCLIIEPQLFASADTFKKEFTSTSLSALPSTSVPSPQITPSNMHMYATLSAQMAAAVSAANACRNLNPTPASKIRRVQTSSQQASAAINLSYSSPSTSCATSSPTTFGTQGINGNNVNSSTSFSNFLPSFGLSAPSACSTSATNGPTPPKRPKNSDAEISAILHANRDLDANTLFFLSLARSVRSMPTKFQSLAKMRCIRIVSDIEMELDNLGCEGADGSGNNTKYCTTTGNDSPPPAIGSQVNEPHNSEHFVYVMSPSRVESMIDLSSDDESTQNANSTTTNGVNAT